MNKTTPQQTQFYKTSVWAHIEMLNNFISGRVSMCLQGMQWATDYNKLQYDILKSLKPCYYYSAWEQL